MTTQIPTGNETAIFGMGCFWGAERLLWQLEGVTSTAVGYAGGHTTNPTYKDICYLDTGHAEVVHVVFDPAQISYQMLLKTFWESHNPTQGMRQGNDVGSQYRSMIMYTTETQRVEALASKDVYNEQLNAASYPAITTSFLWPRIIIRDIWRKIQTGIAALVARVCRALLLPSTLKDVFSICVKRSTFPAEHTRSF
jgi:methionine-S-sulfoxide reductase